MSQNLLEKLPKIRGQYRQNVKIKNWFDVGGDAEILFKPADLEDLQHFVKNCPKEITITILGAASNVIIRDGGVKGVVIRLGAEFAKIIKQNDEVVIGAATLCANASRFCQENGLAGLEFFSGIPGSIGGAIAMNAGCYGNDVAHSLISAKALDYQGNIHELKNSDFGFYYRGNKISSQFIFVEGRFKSIKSSIEEVSTKITELNKKREEAQPIRAKTGGSTFKNPFADDLAQKKAWQFIDEAGCRGLKIGDAQMSEKHCNFMINTANAKAKDLIELGDRVKKAVKDKSGVDLTWEIKIIGVDLEK